MVFTVSCPECRSEFPVDSAKVPEEGVYAQCSMCPGVFLVERPTEELADVSFAETEDESSSGAWGPAVEAEDEAQEPVAAQDPDDWMLEADVDDESDEDAAPGPDPAEDEPIEAAVEFDVADSGFGDDEGAGEQADPAPAESQPAPTAVAEPSSGGFGQSDPDARAARLARVLVSDMMTYNPAMYEKAMSQGTLVEDFEDEVKRSWSEYVEQVGEDVARSTPHFTRALNDILAKGDEVFEESMYE